MLYLLHLYNIHTNVALSNTISYCPDTKMKSCTPMDYTYFSNAFSEHLIDLDIIYFRHKTNAAKVITTYI
jgi:hypothetical protein